MTLVTFPHTFVLVPVLVKLDAKTIFAVVRPVAYVTRGLLPFLTFYTTVLLTLLFLGND